MFFPANLPYEKWPHVSGVFTLMIEQKWDKVEAYFNDPANNQNIKDAIGAGNHWYNLFNPNPQVFPTNPATLGMHEKIPDFPSPSGQINVTEITADGGKVSMAAASGGIPVWISLDPTFPEDAAKTSYGSGTTGYLYPKTGDKLYSRQTGDDQSGVPNIHLSMESK